MPDKTVKNQQLARRKPRQERSLHKVTLILEATQQLLESGDIDTLTTNAVAEKAGVSIGTLYQYFDGKPAIVNALAERELGTMAERVMAVFTETSPERSMEARMRLIVNAVLDSYGGRRGVHRQLLEHALTRGTRLKPLLASVTARLLDSEGEGRPAGARPLAQAEAFVVTQAVAGVLRGMVAAPELALDRDEVAAALARLIGGFRNAADEK
ncbi:TetR/AcrR family transcriptional regulator [Paraburkholderia ferrariae]|jgi:AcrR family transcriptional regulator|uniref:TetR/AcrR family transcriptional regulator n=1 Tax=Paraburkholderia ferrariae TaxID=386056 RepID=UPI0009FCDF32|nr:TetR/AcrR family transcriptional regulator [Paraburkholderia ferrariae]